MSRVEEIVEKLFEIKPPPRIMTKLYRYTATLYLKDSDIDVSFIEDKFIRQICGRLTSVQFEISRAAPYEAVLNLRTQRSPINHLTDRINYALKDNLRDYFRRASNRYHMLKIYKWAIYQGILSEEELLEKRLSLVKYLYKGQEQRLSINNTDNKIEDFTKQKKVLTQIMNTDERFIEHAKSSNRHRRRY